VGVTRKTFDASASGLERKLDMAAYLRAVDALLAAERA
jgi:hypothetical protein